LDSDLPLAALGFVPNAVLLLLLGVILVLSAVEIWKHQ
jgi:hypothetical protein